MEDKYKYNITMLCAALIILLVTSVNTYFSRGRDTNILITAFVFGTHIELIATGIGLMVNAIQNHKSLYWIGAVLSTIIPSMSLYLLFSSGYLHI